MALANEHSQTETITKPNQYCQDLFEKISKTHTLVQNNLSRIAETQTKTIDIPYYFSLNDKVFLFSPVYPNTLTKVSKIFGLVHTKSSK